jgi:hypothetical protein
MAKMRAVQVARAGGPLELVERDVPEPARGEVRVRVEVCGVCHSDSFTIEGQWPNLSFPRIPGHEIAGVIDAVGAGVVGWRVGRRLVWRELRDNERIRSFSENPKSSPCRRFASHRRYRSSPDPESVESLALADARLIGRQSTSRTRFLRLSERYTGAGIEHIFLGFGARGETLDQLGDLHAESIGSRACRTDRHAGRRLAVDGNAVHEMVPSALMRGSQVRT